VVDFKYLIWIEIKQITISHHPLPPLPKFGIYNSSEEGEKEIYYFYLFYVK
jgi:hypothetical protein